MIDTLTTLEAGENLWLLILTIRGNDKGCYWVADCFLRRIAEYAFGTSVPTRNDAVQVLTNNGVIGRVYDGA